MFRDASNLRTRHRRATAVVGLVLLASLAFTSIGLAAGQTPTKGPIPPEAFKNGTIDKTVVPDFIPALNRDGFVAGYVAKNLAIPDGEGSAEPVPVYAEDLETVVGHMYPGRGFVPLALILQ